MDTKQFDFKFDYLTLKQRAVIYGLTGGNIESVITLPVFTKEAKIHLYYVPGSSKVTYADGRSVYRTIVSGIAAKSFDLRSERLVDPNINWRGIQLSKSQQADMEAYLESVVPPKKQNSVNKPKGD